MAAANEAVMEPKMTECSVCHEPFINSKILPCGHLLCRGCLVALLQSRPNAVCPLCRCVIVDFIKLGGRSVEEVADGLPTDLAMTAMVEAETLLSKQHVCCVHAHATAVALCLQCGDMFCEDCRNVHKKQKATMHHEVEELSTLTAERLAACHPATCPDHEKEISKVYCPTHGISVCLLDATTTHRNCPNLVSLQSHIDDLTTELTQLSDNMAEKAAKADACLGLLDNHVAEFQRDSQVALDEMREVCDQLKADIEARFEQVRNMTLDIVSDFTTKANNIRDSIIQKRSKIAAHNNMAKFYQSFAEHKYFEDMVNVVKGRLPDLDTVDSLPEELQLNQKLILTIDSEAVTSAKGIISGLGAVMRIPSEEEERIDPAALGANGNAADPTVEQDLTATPPQGVLSTPPSRFSSLIRFARPQRRRSEARQESHQRRQSEP